MNPEQRPYILAALARWELMDPARRIARQAGRAADMLTQEALVSGAMPGEFRVVHVLRIAPAGFVTRLA
jgi:hypothetical protein